MFWVDVDYLELAAAAARCGAHFTSLLYIEAWQEEQHCWLVPLSATGGPAGGQSVAGASGSGAPGVERLLLDTYSQINEPDGIYAVARSHSMLSQAGAAAGGGAGWWLVVRGCNLNTRLPEQPSIHAPLPPSAPPPQLKRFEHEGDWSRALLSYDLVLQHLLGAQDASSSSSSSGGAAAAAQQQRGGHNALLLGGSLPVAFGSQLPGGGAGPSQGPVAPTQAGDSFEGIGQAAAVSGLLRSLAQLGAGHLLRVYAQSPGVPDAAAEAAMSLGRWGQLGSSVASGGSGTDGGGGFCLDAALSAAVAGVEAGSMERCRQAVAGARRSLVANLVTASLEGAANVNPALVQLQMLQAVSEAWELMWPALPDLGSVGSPRKRRRHPGSDGPQAAAAGVAAAAGGAAGGALLEGVLQLWRGREAAAGAGGRYNLQAPLQVGRMVVALRPWGASDGQRWVARQGLWVPPLAPHWLPQLRYLPAPPLLDAEHARAAAGPPGRPRQAGRPAGGSSGVSAQDG